MDRHSVEIIKLESVDHINQVAAEEWLQQSFTAKQRGVFNLALSGGSTPKKLYSKLIQEKKFHEQIPWNIIHFFWGDERTVPPDHPDSNFHMAWEAMLKHLTITEKQLHRIPAEDPDPNLAAEKYEQDIRKHFNVESGIPEFDLIFLGMGPDGHTASLFPGTEALHERKKLVAANHVRKLNTTRLTMTFPLLNNASCVIFLVAGEDKAEALKAVLEGPPNPEVYPAQMIRPKARLLWLIDHAAGRLLSP
jgi:6-phosphogluconolactonase